MKKNMGHMMMVLTMTGVLGLVAIAPNHVHAHSNTNTNTNQAAAATVNTAPAATQQAVPQEPCCAYCQMILYPQKHELGAFTAQLVTADGQHLFFDDVGCLLNYQRTMKAPAKVAWVRDYNTKEWIEYKKAVPVKAQINTPMKYGIALFKDDASASAFIKSNQAVKPEKTTWQSVDQAALVRHQKKMESMHGPMKP